MPVIVLPTRLSSRWTVYKLFGSTCSTICVHVEVLIKWNACTQPYTTQSVHCSAIILIYTIVCLGFE